MRFIYIPSKIISWFLIKLIRVYQKTLSADHGVGSYLYPHRRCIYYPSCSEYTVEAIEKKGLCVGLLYGVYRVLRCNPWSKGGVDLLVNNSPKE